MRRARAVVIVIAILLATPALDAYLKLGTMVGSTLVALHWGAFPVRYFVTNRDVPGVSAPQLQQAVSRALASWAAVPDVAISSQFVGFTASAPLPGDGMTVVGFQDRPDLDRVLGSTSFTIDAVSGEVIESDIFLNSTFAWSVSDAGESGKQDVQSIALHELGHLLGLGHSALGETELFAGGRRVLGSEAVMFPIAFTAGYLNRELRPDDQTGLEDIYGNDHFRSVTGSVTGRVTKNGTGVLGAHVVAFSPASGTMIAGFTLAADGTFTIAGLVPGLYVVRAEPLDDADVGSFIDPAGVDIDFKPAIYGKLVSVPRGGTAASIEVKVTPK